MAQPQMQQLNKETTTPRHKSFNNDASREVNDARTSSSSTKSKLGRAFAQVLCQGVTAPIRPTMERMQEVLQRCLQEGKIA